jgi:hypothetical protein
MFFLYVFSSTKSENKRVEQVLPGGGGMGVRYTHVSKCKNDKILKNQNLEKKYLRGKKI